MGIFIEVEREVIFYLWPVIASAMRRVFFKNLRRFFYA